MPAPCASVLSRASVRDVPDTQRLGWLLREIRARARLSQEDLAHMAGVGRSQVSRWETGQHAPAYRNIRQLAVRLSADCPEVDEWSGELVEAAGYGPPPAPAWRPEDLLKPGDPDGFRRLAEDPDPLLTPALKRWLLEKGRERLALEREAERAERDAS